MKKDFVSVFNKDIAIDEYELDNLLDKNIEVKENEFPTILIDREDDTNKYININNNSNFNSNENLIEENIITENNIINTIETENIITENKINYLSEAYTEEENNLYNEAKNNISLTEDDLTDIENVEEFNLEDAVFGSKDNDIYKNNSEKSNMQEIDLMEEDNLKKEDEILEYDDKEVIVPSIDNVDYIDESDYIKSINSNNEVIELSGNELDLITKDKDINEDKENIIVSDDNMRKDNFVLEEQIIENEPTNIDDIENNKEKEEKTNYYINKFKKMHEDYIKSIEENKETENNKINNETEIKEEITENENIENTEEVENIEEVNKIETPIIEATEEIKEELKTNEAETIENITEEIEKEEDDLETTDKLIEEEDKTNFYINKFKKMHDEYVKSIEENKETEIKEEITENKNIENTEEVKLENVESEKVENIEEVNIETSTIEEPEEIKEELETTETEATENITEEIKEEDDLETTDKLIEEEDKTNFYINKFKKMHEEYVKSIEENKETENNKSNNETEIKEEITENKNIENVEIEKVENIEEVNKVESPTIEEPEKIKEELETEAAENITEDIKSLDNSEITDKLSVEEEEMYKAYLGDDANLIEEVEDIIPEETEEKEEEAPLMNTLEITDILSAEEEEMYKAYLGNDSNSIEEIEDLIPKENEEINMELEIAKNELKKKEETLSKLEIIGELSAEEESIFDDILQQNKNRYYEDDINNADIILKDLNLDEIEEINENDFNILENFILGKEPEEGIELISINNENDSNKNDDNQIKSIEDFDSIDSEELLNAKETKMPEEKELKIEEQNIDLNAKVDEEFTLNKDDSILTNEKINQRENGKEDFDGEITQMDLDLAEKLFETGDQKNNEDYGPKHDLLLSENDIVKFRKLFSYFKIIVDKLPKESLNDFSKTEFYDTYSSLFRKFGE